MAAAIVGAQYALIFADSEAIFFLAEIAFTNLKLSGASQRVIRVKLKKRGEGEIGFRVFMPAEENRRLTIGFYRTVVRKAGLGVFQRSICRNLWIDAYAANVRNTSAHRMYAGSSVFQMQRMFDTGARAIDFFVHRRNLRVNLAIAGFA